MADLKKDKVIIISGIIAVAFIVIATFVGKQRKKKVYTRIEQKILGGAISGEISDLQTSNAFSPTYWKTATGATLLPVAQAKHIANTFNDLFSSFKIKFGDACPAVIKGLQQLKNKAQVSQVTFYYNQLGNSFYDDLSKLDKQKGTLFGIHWDIFNILTGTCSDSILKYINSLPEK